MDDPLHCTRCGNPSTIRPDGHAECPQGHIDYRNPAPAVGVAVLRGDQILLAKRARPPKQGQWDLVGGFVECGETGVQAVARELAEETGMTLRAAELVDVLPGDYDGQPTINLLYIGQADGEPDAQDDVAALKWFPLNKPPSTLAWPHEAAMLERLQAMAEAALKDL